MSILITLVSTFSAMMTIVWFLYLFICILRCVTIFVCHSLTHSQCLFSGYWFHFCHFVILLY
jgi:hypothetical protein